MSAWPGQAHVTSSSSRELAPGGIPPLLTRQHGDRPPCPVAQVSPRLLNLGQGVFSLCVLCVFISALGWMPRGRLHTNSVRAQGTGAPGCSLVTAQGTAALASADALQQRGLQHGLSARVRLLQSSCLSASSECVRSSGQGPMCRRRVSTAPTLLLGLS